MSSIQTDRQSERGQKYEDRLSFRVPPDLYEAVHIRVKRNRTSVQDFCTTALRQHLKALDSSEMSSDTTEAA